ncbi:hypothetical protein C8Q70DRAFT_1026747 [Cubamyces menziesii]|nr:hypothetical protein C8Q70DRAFT_1026747 [Cubamyces menziesii]
MRLLRIGCLAGCARIASCIRLVVDCQSGLVAVCLARCGRMYAYYIRAASRLGWHSALSAHHAFHSERTSGSCTGRNTYSTLSDRQVPYLQVVRVPDASIPTPCVAAGRQVEHAPV